jgi:hypothetical protein
MLVRLYTNVLERAKGIEPSYEAWEASVLPLNYARGGSLIGETPMRRNTRTAWVVVQFERLLSWPPTEAAIHRAHVYARIAILFDGRPGRSPAVTAKDQTVPLPKCESVPESLPRPRGKRKAPAAHPRQGLSIVIRQGQRCPALRPLP